MDKELFNPQSLSVSSSRIIYTPSTFARTSLLHLQEVGSLQAVHPHVSQREDLMSFLCFIVLSGEGELSYEEQTYQLSEGDCVFIDCRKAYNSFVFVCAISYYKKILHRKKPDAAVTARPQPVPRMSERS